MAMLLESARLAIAEQRANANAVLCFVVAFSAMLSPLLLILGLKTGLIDRLTSQLVENPESREILPVGAGLYDRAFFKRVRALPATGFVAPSTRTIAARFTLVRAPRTGESMRGLAIWPSGAGDPLLPAAAPAPADDEIALTHEAARRLGVTRGDRLEVFVERHRERHDDVVRLEVRVGAVAAAEATAASAALVAPELLFAVEAFLDDETITPERWRATDLDQRFAVAASFRLYAASIYDVAALRDAVEGWGANIRVRSDDVALVLRLDRTLDRLYVVLATCAAVGFWLALAANLRANVERLRPSLSALALLGATPWVRFGLPMAQALSIAAAGLAASFACYALGARGFDLLLRDIVAESGRLTALSLGQIATVVAIVVVGALLAGAWAAVAAVRIEPEEVLRWA